MVPRRDGIEFRRTRHRWPAGNDVAHIWDDSSEGSES